MTRVGSLCSGYGGLELGAALALGPLDHMWHAEYDPTSKLDLENQPAARVLATRWPDVPNLGDIAAITATNRWADLPPIDLLCAGYPCQGESDAGLRRGKDDPRFQWPNVAAAIRALRPRIVILENVRGHLNRSFPQVVADLAAIGYVGRWRCVRASDAGAPHQRNRLYVAAWPAGQQPPELPAGNTAAPAGELTAALLPTPKASDVGTEGWRASEGFRPPLSQVVFEKLLPTPRTTDANGAGTHGDGGIDLRTAVTLLPTPTAERAGNNHGGAAGRVGPIRPSLDQVGALLPTPTGRDHKGAGWGDQPGRPLSETIHRLLPTRKSSDGAKGGPNQQGSSGDLGLPAAVQPDRWGNYAPAIARWEAVTGRPAPEPTTEGRNGRRQLSPRFVEWMMGLPEGWVTDIIDHRGNALKVLGNGVVPQAAALAVALILAPQQPALFDMGVTAASA